MTVDQTAEGEWSIDRRTVLRGVGTASALGVVGVSGLSGSALARELETCGLLDVYCAIDVSGSLSSAESSGLETAVNDFVGALPTDGSVTVGTVEFGNADSVQNRTPLQDPAGLTVSVSSPSGNTPMPGALDVADQALYGDPNARADAVKLVVVFTDGGPNYPPEASYSATYAAPRDGTDDWSAVGGNAIYDNGDTASATVTAGEMTETALVASSVKSGSVGDGATMIATVYVGQDDDTEAMTSDALAQYTDLPTYLREEIASSSEFAITTDLEDVSGLVDELVALLAELCCEDCPSAFEYTFEWVETEDAEGSCAGEFVVYDADDQVVEDVDGLELVSVTCDEDGEPREACFETAYCALDYEVKAGRETAGDTVSAEDGTFCVTGIESSNPRGKAVTHAISNVTFTCPSAEQESSGPPRGRPE